MVSYNFIFFLAALQSIPRSLTEAAAMDGAGVLRRMWDLQLPLMTPTFFFLLVINITDSFTDSFGIVDTLTQGGPARATDLMVYKIYSDGFKGFDYSGAAAQSIILMLLVMALTFVQFRYVERACTIPEGGPMIERTPILNFLTHLILLGLYDPDPADLDRLCGRQPRR
jgi:sn-glycerol 3-phosphate transport system permease protein